MNGRKKGQIAQRALCPVNGPLKKTLYLAPIAVSGNNSVNKKQYLSSIGDVTWVPVLGRLKGPRYNSIISES